MKNKSPLYAHKLVLSPYSYYIPINIAHAILIPSLLLVLNLYSSTNSILPYYLAKIDQLMLELIIFHARC
jgi:hypothetical protein